MNIGVIFAGGVGSRLGMIGRPKQFVEINGKPIIIHTLEHFENCSEVDKVVVVCLINWIEYMWKLVDEYDLKKVAVIVPGGATGQESIYEGLIEARKISDASDTIVLIHDGVRPLIDEKLLVNCINSVKQYGSAVACAPIPETPIFIEKGQVIGTSPRKTAQVGKAPQCFWLNDVLEAHEDAVRQGKTDYLDTCSLMLQYHPTLHAVECGIENIKVTTFEDIYLLQALLRARQDKKNFWDGGGI